MPLEKPDQSGPADGRGHYEYYTANDPYQLGTSYTTACREQPERPGTACTASHRPVLRGRYLP